MTTINPDKLARLDQIELGLGAHKNFDDGTCAMEVVSWLADEGFTDAPKCASPIIRNYTIDLNDHWDDAQRQQLKPYLVRMIGTGSDGKDGARQEILRREVAALMSPWLRLIGMFEAADHIAATKTDEEMLEAFIKTTWQIRDRRIKQSDKVTERIEAELKKCDLTAITAVANTISRVVADTITSTVVITAIADATILAIFNSVADFSTKSSAAGISRATEDVKYAAIAAMGDYIEVFSKEWRTIWEAAHNAALIKALRLICEDTAFEDLYKLRDEQDGAALRILDKIITADA